MALNHEALGRWLLAAGILVLSFNEVLFGSFETRLLGWVPAVLFSAAGLGFAAQTASPWAVRGFDLASAALCALVAVLVVTGPAFAADVPGEAWLVVVAAAAAAGATGRAAQVVEAHEVTLGPIAGAGIGFVVVGGLEAMIQGPSPLARVLLGSGGALLLAYTLLDRQRIGHTVGSRPFQYGTGAVLVTMLATALAIGAFALSRRNDKTWDWTHAGAFTLSDQAGSVAGSLSFDVTVAAYFRASNPGKARFASLIDRFQEHTDRFEVDWVDPLREPRRATEADVTGDHGTVVLTGNGKTQRLEWEFDESEFVRALVLLSATESHEVCWATGHGEVDPDDEMSEAGLGVMRLELEGLNYQVRRLEVATAGIPKSCVVLVVARPTVEWFAYEREALAAYIAQGGRALALLDMGDVPDLAASMARFGVTVGDDVVLDLDPSHQLLGMEDPAFLVISPENVGHHMITRSMGGVVVMALARSVSAATDLPEGLKVESLLRTSAEAWGERDPAGVAVAPDPGEEVVGHVPIMAVVTVDDPAVLEVVAANPEDDIGRGVPADFEPAPGGRLVVIGDATFASNQFYAWGSNRDVFLNAVAWLADEEKQIGERPAEGETLEISLAAQLLTGAFDILLLPGALAFGAVLTLYRRRSQ